MDVSGNDNPEPSQTRLYALRRTLALWKFDEWLADLLRTCDEACVDEVIVKVDAEEFSHGLPTLDCARAYFAPLRQTRDALARRGITFSLNPWVTVGHVDRGRDLRNIFPNFQWMVGHDGASCRAQACPLCPRFREYLTELWSEYASLRPNVIWIEDDLRTFNHQPVRFGCFCPLHLDRFARRTNAADASREGLLRAILLPGEPHPWRGMWLDLQCEATEQLVGLMTSAVRSVSPETKLGLMSSGPELHCLEGRKWRYLKEIMAGATGQAHSRPTLGNYTEESPRGLYYAAAQIKRTRFVFGTDVTEQTEIENVPFTGYSKSRLFTSMQIALSVALGCDGATLNLFDHVGSPTDVDQDAAITLRDERPFLEGIGRAMRGSFIFRGIQILHDDRASYVRRLSPGSDYAELAPNDYHFEYALNALGFPTTYDDAPVAAADGQIIDALTDEKIRLLLQQGLLLDASAAQILERRGFGKYIGVSIRELSRLHEGQAVSAEALTDSLFGGGVDRYLTMTLPDLRANGPFALIDALPGSRVISRLVDQDRREIAPFITLFENELGGRVATVPLLLAGAMGTAFLHPYRQAQFDAVLRWLGRGQLSASVRGGVYPLATRADFNDRIVLSIFNLSLDVWPQVEWDLGLSDRQVLSTTLLDSQGLLKPADLSLNVERSTARLRLKTSLPFGLPMIVVLHSK